MTTNGSVIDDRYVQAGWYLTALHVRLQQVGLLTLYEPSWEPVDGPPQLVVFDAKPASHEDVIHVAPRLTEGDDVEWCFLWDWGEWICRVDKLDEAATRIAEMLRRP